MADTVIAASLSLNSQQANQSVKDFKTELKQAQAEVIELSRSLPRRILMVS